MDPQPHLPQAHRQARHHPALAPPHSSPACHSSRQRVPPGLANTPVHDFSAFLVICFEIPTRLGLARLHLEAFPLVGYGRSGGKPLSEPRLAVDASEFRSKWPKTAHRAAAPSRALKPREGGSRNSGRQPRASAARARHVRAPGRGAPLARPSITPRRRPAPSDPRSCAPHAKSARPLRHQADEGGRSQAPKAPREATWRRYSAVAVSTSTEPSFSVASPGRPAPTKASRAPRASRSFSARFALATAIISLMRLS